MRAAFFVDVARDEDVAQLAALSAASFSHPWNAGQIRAEVLRAAGGGVLVARARGAQGVLALCGSCTYSVVADEMEILELAVLPEWRRRGVARFLAHLALRRAARAGARSAFLEVRVGNAAARSLYAALGFREAGLRRSYYSQPREDALLMRRDALEDLC